MATPLPNTLKTLIAAVTEQCRVIAASGAAAEGLLGALDSLGTAHELLLQANGARRHSGSHYTPGALCELVIEYTLAPLLTDSSQPLTSGRLLALRVCDPAMGTGAFLLRCCQYLAERLANAWQSENAPELKTSQRVAPIFLARRAIAQHCIYGVDRSPSAVELARVSMTLFTHTPQLPPLDFTENLRCGDALVGAVFADPAPAKTRKTTALPAQPFHWTLEFPQVLRAGGFDAIIGNPPWIAYAGRAAQPLEPKLARYYKATSPAFAGYRTLHGLFVYRAAQLLKLGGRLGLVVPTSIVDLDGYRPTRNALETLCAVDSPLNDFGDGQFPGVFQPCVALCATRQTKQDTAPSSTWTLTRNDLGPEASALLSRLAALPQLPPELFGERGFQSTAADRSQMRRQARARAGFAIPLREGSDIVEFVAHPPTLFAAKAQLGSRLRSAAQWRQVRLLIRQTARFPIAAPADGTPFRNSVLAGFSTEQFSEFFLLCYLNSDVIRWYHFMSKRDARQGMPQLKIGHLRHLPAPANRVAIAHLHDFGKTLAAEGRAPNTEERARLNKLSFAALRLNSSEQRLVTRWAQDNPPPKSRQFRIPS